MASTCGPSRADTLRGISLDFRRPSGGAAGARPGAASQAPLFNSRSIDFSPVSDFYDADNQNGILDFV
jgi:hypothetical protein